MDEDYKCTLSEACLKQAMSELSEDPKDGLSAVQTLREWIETQKHLNCRTGKVSGATFTTGRKRFAKLTDVYLDFKLWCQDPRQLCHKRTKNILNCTFDTWAWDRFYMRSTT